MKAPQGGAWKADDREGFGRVAGGQWLKEIFVEIVGEVEWHLERLRRLWLEPRAGEVVRDLVLRVCGGWGRVGRVGYFCGA